jgi:hypothetical protein
MCLAILGWRRSHRPSLYDISIIDEEEERDNDPDSEDPEIKPDLHTVQNTIQNAQSFNNLPQQMPAFTISK